MTRILAIDPGNTESGWCLINEDAEPLHFGKTENVELRRMLLTPEDEVGADKVVVEMIGHYGSGMPAGKDVFDTCLWIGRFCEAIRGNWYPWSEPELIKRATVKAHLCGSAKAKDSNVRQALVDRFAPGQPNHGKGTKAEPGWFHGFAADVWQAYALAVYAADTMVGSPVNVRPEGHVHDAPTHDPLGGAGHWEGQP